MSANNGPLVLSENDSQGVASAMRFIQQAIMMDLECCLPARVVGYDRKENTATVRPLIMTSVRPEAGGDLIRNPRVSVPEIPVLSLGAGGFHINFPVKEGDLGWIYACDRDITLFLQNLQEQPAGSDGATHKFSDAIFIPDVYRNYTISGEDEGALVIQSTSSETRISVREDNIKITTPVKVELDTPDTIITGRLTVNGDVQLDASLTVAGPDCALPAGTTVNGAVVYGHNHNGLVPGFQ